MSRSVKQTRLSPFSSSPPVARFEEPPKASGVSPLKSVTTNLWWMTCPLPPLRFDGLRHVLFEVRERDERAARRVARPLHVQRAVEPLRGAECVQLGPG